MEQKKTVEEWRGIIRSWQDSGQSQRVFCMEQGIPLSAFYYWRPRVKKQETEPAGLVRINTKPAESLPTQHIQIESDFCTVRLFGGVEEQTIGAILKALKAVQ